MLPVGRDLMIVTLLVCLVSLPTRADAAPIDLETLSSGNYAISGTFAFDNDVALFSFFLPGAAVLGIDFLSLLQPAPGEQYLGFDPTVTFFGPGSAFNNGFLGNAQFDGASGLTSNPNLFADFPPLLQGTYVIAVSLFENLYDPESGAFLYAGPGNENFTTTLGYAVPDCLSFVTPSGCRSGRFDATLTVELENAQPVPEPGSLTLLALGSAALLAHRGRRSRSGTRAARRN